VWTLIGLIFGAAYNGVRDPASATPSGTTWMFAASAAAFSLVLAAAASMLLRRVTWEVVLIGVTSAACFGLLLPALAER
jgi:hypothetical protein